MSSIPSVSNPPNAPKKAKAGARVNQHEEEEVLSQQWLKNRGVRPKFLRYKPEDIEEIDDFDTLVYIRDLYMPASQPENLYELSYCMLMTEIIEEKLCIL